MAETARGLVLRVRPLTETSLVVHWLTPAQGRVATVAKGALRPKSPFRGKLDLFFEAEFSFVRSRRSDLHLLRELVLVDTHAAIRRDLALLQAASYAALLVEQTTETETPLEDVFALARGFLQALPPPGANPTLVLGFELKLLAILGLGPLPGQTRLSPAARALMTALAVSNWASFRTLEASPDSLRQLDQFLHGYLIYHLGKLARGRSAALGSGES